jgi:hypothetical protein
VYVQLAPGLQCDQVGQASRYVVHDRRKVLYIWGKNSVKSLEVPR